MFIGDRREHCLKCTLLEFDMRFASLGDFVFYDYNEPEAVASTLAHVFDAVVADPPYLVRFVVQFELMGTCIE